MFWLECSLLGLALSTLAWTLLDPPLYTSHVAWTTGVYIMTAFLLVEMGSFKLFAQADLEPWSS
jgi:hypothetical protein